MKNGSCAGAFHYYDSLGNANLVSAKIAKQRLSDVLQASTTDKEALAALKEATFEAHNCSQQDNGFDCGVFVIGFMKELVKRLLSSQEGVNEKIWDLGSTKITPQDEVSALLDSIRKAVSGEDTSPWIRRSN